MGTTVPDLGPSPTENLHRYAQCLRAAKGGVAVLAINADRAASASLEVPLTAQRYTLTAQNLTDAKVRMNGRELKLGNHDSLPALSGAPEKPGRVSFAPASITFLAIADAHNPACQ